MEQSAGSIPVLKSVYIELDEDFIKEIINGEFIKEDCNLSR